MPTGDGRYTRCGAVDPVTGSRCGRKIGHDGLHQVSGQYRNRQWGDVASEPTQPSKEEGLTDE